MIHRAQDVEPILEGNKTLYNSGDGYGPTREIRRVARIPKVVAEQWAREGCDIFNPEHEAELTRRLNDPTNLFLRTAPGRV